MQFTNVHGYDRAIENFLKYSDYNASGTKFDISATRLIDSPLISSLWREYGNEVVQDIYDNLPSSVGSGVHKRLEDANANDPSIICEKRFIGSEPHPTDPDKVLTISAQLDVLDLNTNKIADLKTTSVYKLIMDDDHASWTNQLNVQAYLARRSGWQVDNVAIYAYARNWEASKVKDKGYPPTQLTVLPLELWSFDKQKEYITERLALHFGDGEKTCSDEERWIRPGKFAVMKTGKARALRLLDTKKKAQSWIKSQGLQDDASTSIEERPTRYIRCEDYCAFGKMGVCPQYTPQGSKQ